MRLRKDRLNDLEQFTHGSRIGRALVHQCTVLKIL
jgi:hypothetical protein